MYIHTSPLSNLLYTDSLSFPHSNQSFHNNTYIPIQRLNIGATVSFLQSSQYLPYTQFQQASTHATRKEDIHRDDDDDNNADDDGDYYADNAGDDDGGDDEDNFEVDDTDYDDDIREDDATK